MTTLEQSFSLGPLALTVGQALLAIAFIIALLVGALMARGRQVPIADTLFNTLLVALVGARLVFVVRYWGSYDSLWGMLDIRDGGFDVLGGVVIAMLYTAWNLWRHPARRKVLIGALTAGAISWGMTGGILLLIDQHARPMPDVPLATLDGQLTSLPELVTMNPGKPMVVNLWATWCPPCVREMPILEEAQRTMPDTTFVLVNQGEDGSHVMRFLGEHELTLDNVLLDVRLALGSATGSHVMPTTLFYDAEGRLVDAHAGELSRATLQRGLDRLQ